MTSDTSKPMALARTVYLGDRGIKQIVLDSWNRIAKVQVDLISRVRSSDGKWNFYSAEDIVDGFLVFGAARSLAIEPLGAIPDDYVVSFELRPDKTTPKIFEAVIHTAGTSASGDRCEVVVRIVAETFFLEDPNRPGEQIR